jgi:glycosyl hydrolase family 9
MTVARSAPRTKPVATLRRTVLALRTKDGSSSDRVPGDPQKFLPIVTCVENAAQYSANQLNCGFYTEDSYYDDMALGAIMLYQATASAAYLTDACTYASLAAAAYGPLVWLSVHEVLAFGAP